MEATEEPTSVPTSVPVRPTGRRQGQSAQLPAAGLSLTEAPSGSAGIVPGSPEDVCQLLRQIRRLLEPANDLRTLTYSQVGTPKNGFGSGGANLVVVQNGQAVATLVSPVPPNVRTVTLRNLSALTELLYWFSDAPQATPPANAYSHLPEGQAIALDVWDLSYLYVMADPAATDAGVDVQFLFYNPKKAAT